VHQRTDARALEHMTEVRSEAVRDVDRGARDAAQPLPQLDARLGHLEPGARGRRQRPIEPHPPLPRGERGRSLP
jgi:hypothetical protein